MKKLEGSTVQRLAVAAGDCKIEIERARRRPAGAAPAAVGDVAALPGPVAPGRRPGHGRVAGRARGVRRRSRSATPRRTTASRCSRRSSAPSTRRRSRARSRSSQVGDVVEAGQTVCIVEAMKLMNEVVAGEGGQVAEILAENGEPVEFEQVLMYLEPVED